MPERYVGEFRGDRPFVKLSANGHDLWFMIDTGFDADMLMTEDQALELGLTSLGSMKVRWFDGSIAAVELAKANLDWFGRTRECRTLISRRGNFTLIGMGLLKETLLEVEYGIQLVRITNRGQPIFSGLRQRKKG